MKKCNILIPIGCRSDEGLSAPVIRRLKEQDWCIVETHQLEAGNFEVSFVELNNDLISHKFDLCLITGDRIEMMACAQACFLNHVKIAHFYAGIIDYSFVLFDDIHRHCITLMSDIAFCEDQQSAVRVKELWSTIGRFKTLVGNDTKSLERKNIYNVGISHMDDLEIDESLVSRIDCGSCECLIDCNKAKLNRGCIEPYDLVLINPEPRGRSELELFKEADMITKQFYRKSIWIPSNPDQEEFLIGKVNFDYPTLPRSQYLGLLQNCTRFISNSSSIHYEAFPLGLKEEQIVFIGSRNKNRSTPKKLETGASDKIVNILKKWWQNEQL